MSNRFDQSRILVFSWVTVIALALSIFIVNKSFASPTPSIKKQLDIAAGQTAKFNFSMKKDEPSGISITGFSQATASGFRGDCKAYSSAGKFTYWSLDFRNDYVSSGVIFSETGGSYFLNCTNLSTQEDAKIVISIVSFESVANPNNGSITVLGMESALVGVKMTKDIPLVLTILGSGQATASGFRGDCKVYSSAGKFTYLILDFRNDFGNDLNFRPDYSGDLFLFCTNQSQEKAVLILGIHSTKSIQSGTVSTISIAPNDFAVLRFTTQKSQPISISTKGNSKKTTSGFYGDCKILDENAKFTYRSFGFRNGTVVSEVFTPTYSGFHYLVCKNPTAEAAIFEVFGITELKRLTMTSDFLIAGEGPTATKASSSPKPSVSSTPSPSATVTNPQGGSGQSSGTPSGSGSVINPQVQTSVDQATRLASVATDAAVNLNTNGFNEKAYRDALDTINKAIETANSAVEKAKNSAKNAKDSAKDAAESQVKAAEKALEAAKSAKQAANEAKGINSIISEIRDASKNTQIRQVKSSSKSCGIGITVAGVVGALGVAGVIATGGGAAPIFLATTAAVASVTGAALC